MSISRLLSLVVIASVVSVPAARAQFGGTPSTPGSGAPGGLGEAPACRQVLALRDETQKSAVAIHDFADKTNAQHKPLDPVEICKLFKMFIASDAKYIQSIQTDAQTCEVPPTLIEHVQEGHVKATEIAKQVCDAAEHARPADDPSRPFPAYDPYFPWASLLR